MNMDEKRYDMSPVDGPARRWYVPDVVLLSKLVGLHAVLFAILHGERPANPSLHGGAPAILYLP